MYRVSIAVSSNYTRTSEINFDLNSGSKSIAQSRVIPRPHYHAQGKERETRAQFRFILPILPYPAIPCPQITRQIRAISPCARSPVNRTNIENDPRMADRVQSPERTGAASPGHSGQTISHRSSFAENMRQSPRSQRHPSFPQSAVQELLNHPPAAKTGDPRFVGRDWKQIRVGELVTKEEVRWAQLETGVEQATKVSQSLIIWVHIPNHE